MQGSFPYKKPIETGVIFLYIPKDIFLVSKILESEKL
jgi:hypothetical protein